MLKNRLEPVAKFLAVVCSLFIPYVLTGELTFLILFFLCAPIVIFLLKKTGNEGNKIDSISQHFSKAYLAYLVLPLVLIFLATIKILSFTFVQKLNWLMAIGWDHVGHIGLYWYGFQHGNAMMAGQDIQNTSVFHYLLGGYPQLWHFAAGKLASAVALPYSKLSLSIYIILVSTTWIVSFFIAFYALLKIINSGSSREQKNSTNNFYRLIIFILTLLITYIFFQFWTSPGWVNFPVSISLAILVIYILYINWKRNNVHFVGDVLILILLPHLYAMTYGILLSIVVLTNLLLVIRNRSQIRKLVPIILAKVLLLIFSFYNFLFLWLQYPKSMLTDDGGGVRLSMNFYLGTTIVLLAITVYRIIKGRLSVGDIVTMAMIAITFTLNHYERNIGYQPYFFSKLATMIVFSAIIFILYNLNGFLKTRTNAARNKFLDLVTSQLVIIIVLIILFQTSSAGIRDSGGTLRWWVYAVPQAFQNPNSKSLLQWEYTARDLLKIDDISYEERKDYRDAKLLSGVGYPYLQNMWLSLLRPNPAYVWTEQVSWDKDTENFNHLIWETSVGSDLNKIKEIVTKEERLSIITKEAECESIKKSESVSFSVIARVVCIN